MNRKNGNPHYHIHWSRVVTLDWECFGTFAEAEASAKELVRRDETYIIEEHGPDCPRCAAALKLKVAHDAPAETVLSFKYSWQQVVFDAFAETRSEFLPLRVNAAQRAISGRLCDKMPAAPEEQIAIREALQSLQALLQEPKKASDQKHDSDEKKATA